MVELLPGEREVLDSSIDCVVPNLINNGTSCFLASR